MPLLDWFLTKSGQSFVSGVAVVGGCSLAGFHTILNTFFLEKYQNFVQMYRNGVPLNVHPNVLKQANDVLAECYLSERQRKAFSFFTVVGFDTTHMGSTKLNGGARVGIPHHFSYNTIADIERGDLMVGGQSGFQFSSNAGQALLGSMVSSDRARRFAIAREINAATTNYVYAHSFISMVSVMLPYSISMVLNRHLNLFRLRRSIRGCVYAITGSIGVVTYFMLHDAVTLAYQRQADKATMRMGLEYARGAVDYYEQELTRNRSLRTALGDAGKNHYTVSGNVTVTVRTRSTPLTVRLDQAKEAVEDWVAKSTAAVEVPEKQ